jgi:hypothetical protein
MKRKLKQHKCGGRCQRARLSHMESWFPKEPEPLGRESQRSILSRYTLLCWRSIFLYKFSSTVSKRKETNRVLIKNGIIEKNKN